MSTGPSLTLRITAAEAVAQLRALSTAAHDLKAALAGINHGSAQAGAAQLRAGEAELTQALKAARMESAALTRQLAEQAQSGTRAAGSLTALERAHTRSSAAAKEHATATRAVTAQQELLHSSTRGAAGALGGLWLTYSRNIAPLAATFATVATIRESIKRGTDYDYTLAFTSALSDEAKLSGRGNYKDKLDTDLRQVAKTTQFSASELAKGLRVMEQTGIDASKGIGLIATAAQAALMGEIDLKTATEDLVGVMEVFKLRTNDPVQLGQNFRRVGDVMSSVAKETKANLHEVATSMQGVIGVAGTFGVKLETVAAVVTQLGKAGIVGPKSGTFARQMFENLYGTQSEQARQVKQVLNITPFKADGTYKNDVDFLVESLRKLKELNPKDQLLATSALFTERGIKPARELLTALDGVAASVERLKNSKGTLADFADSLNGVAKVEWQKVGARWDDLLTGAFKGGEGALTELAKQLQRTFNDPGVQSGITSLISLTGTLATWTGKAAEGWGLIAKAVSSTANEANFNGLIQRRENLQKALQTYGENPHSRAALTATEAQIEAHAITATKRAQRSSEVVAAASARGLLDDGDREIRRAAALAANSKVVAERRPSGPALPLSVTDPRAFTEAQHLLKAQESEQIAAAQREIKRLEQHDRIKLSMLDAQHKYRLMSESAYLAAVQKLEDDTYAREQSAVTAAAENVRASLSGLKAPAARAAAETRVRDLESELERLRVKRSATVDQRGLDLMGKSVVRAQAVHAEAEQITGSIKKLSEELRLSQRDARDASEHALLPGASAASVAARNAVERQFLGETVKLEADRSALSKKTDADSQARVRMLDDELAKLPQKLKLEQQIAETSAVALYERQREFSYGAQDAFNKYQQDATNAAQHARDAVNAGARSMEDGLTRFYTTGKFGARDFANTLISEFARIHARKSAAGILGSLSGIIGGSGGFGIGESGSTAFGSLGTRPFSEQSMMLAAQVLHGGGVVGELARMRSASLALFANAPRFHDGGMPGLRHNEVPVIAERGEGMFTQAQMRALAPVGQRSSNAPQVNVVQHIQIDAKGAGAGVEQRIQAAMVKTKNETKAEILRSIKYNGAFAR